MNIVISNRNYSFDILKGTLILLVVLGHAIQLTYSSVELNVWYQPIFNIIYTFHMPLFIFVSGYFFKNSLNKRTKDLLKNKVKRLLLPACIYSTIIILLYIVITGDKMPSLSFLYKQYKTYWYLICVFILTLFYYFFYKSNNILKVILIIAYVASVIFYDYLPGIILKDCQLIRQTLIFGLGAFISIYQVSYFQLISRKKSIIIVSSCIVPIVLIRYFWGINMMDYPAYIRILDGIVCSMFVLHLIYKRIDKIQNSKWVQPLIYLGQNSLSIYLIHVVFARVYNFVDYSIKFNTVNVVIFTIGLLIISISILEIIKHIFKSSSFIFGI